MTVDDNLDTLPSAPVPSQARPKRSYLTEPSPLVGRVFDESGDRLTPSHANKKGRRYRYYVSDRLIERSGQQEVDSADGCADTGNADEETNTSTKTGNEVAARTNRWRLPATTLEGAVSDAIAEWLAKETLPAKLVKFASAYE